MVVDPLRCDFRINRKGGTAQGDTSKMRSGTRARRNGAFGARAQGFYIFDYRTRHFDTYPNRF